MTTHDQPRSQPTRLHRQSAFLYSLRLPERHLPTLLRVLARVYQDLLASQLPNASSAPEEAR